MDEQYIRTEADRRALARGYYFDEAEAEKIITFAHKYVKPQFVSRRRPFKLLPWQERFLKSIYGWRTPAGARRFNRVILSTPKKQGKTLLCSIIALYEMYFSPITSVFIVSASTTKENATQIYSELAHTVRATPSLAKLAVLTDSTKTLKVKKRNAVYKAISCDGGNAEGLNCSTVVLDELGSHESDHLYKVLEFAMIAREDGFMVSISTPCKDATHFYTRILNSAEDIISGKNVDDLHTYAEIYGCKLDDDHASPEVYRKALPCLGVSFTEESFLADMARAKTNRIDWANFLRYRLGVRNTATLGTSWLDASAWDKGMCVPPEDLSQYPSVIACDLSQTVDTSAVLVLTALPNGQTWVTARGFCCEAGIEKQQKSLLDKYRSFGSVEMTKGNVADYVRIKAYIHELLSTFNVQEIIFDQYNAIQLATELASETRAKVFKFPQTYKYYNPACKALEIAVGEGKVLHNGDEWLRHNVLNMSLKTDQFGNVMPIRENRYNKIDAGICLIMGHSRITALESEARVNNNSGLNKRGIIFI